MEGLRKLGSGSVVIFGQGRVMGGEKKGCKNRDEFEGCPGCSPLW